MKRPPGCDVPAVVSYSVGLLVFQGGDRDDVYFLVTMIFVPRNDMFLTIFY